MEPAKLEPGDAEVGAMMAVAAHLKPLTPEECERVLRWAWERFVPPLSQRKEMANPPRKV